MTGTSSPPEPLSAKLQALAEYFNRGSLDIPDGLIARGCVFALNGRAYDEMLGRPVSDPLTRLIGRGPAAFRFIAQALRYAVPDAHVAMSGLAADAASEAVWHGHAVVEGTPRGDATLGAAATVRLELTGPGEVARVDVQMDRPPLDAIAAARAR